VHWLWREGGRLAWTDLPIDQQVSGVNYFFRHGREV
jgi:hypothetical protein